MLDFTLIILLSLGGATAKTDLNSHQPYSKPAFFTEASARFQKPKLAFFGFRTSYYNVPVEVRSIFQEGFGKSYHIHDLSYAFFIGQGLRFDPENYLSIDGGLAYIAEHSKWGAQSRLRYTREYTTRKGKHFNLSASLGVDYWMQDDFDDHEDVTTLDGDYMFHLTLGFEFPIQKRVR